MTDKDITERLRAELATAAKWGELLDKSLTHAEDEAERFRAAAVRFKSRAEAAEAERDQLRAEVERLEEVFTHTLNSEIYWSNRAEAAEARAATLEQALELLENALPFLGLAASRSQIILGVDAGELYSKIEALLAALKDRQP